MIKLKKDKFKMLYRYFSTVCNFIGICIKGDTVRDMIVVNDTYFREYYEYILDNYDDDMKLINCNSIEIVAINPAFNIEDIIDNRIEL